MTPQSEPNRQRDLVPDRQPGASTARRRCARSREQSAAGRRRARATSAACPVPIVWKPVLTDADAIRRSCSRPTPTTGCIGVIAWMHTFSPAKMWIAGLDALQKPLLHLHTQANRDLPWATIDMDFMNLNQSAHGDREFGYIQTRLGVAAQDRRGHWQRPAVVRPRSAPGRGRAAGWHEPRTCGWPASATTCARSPSPRATRSRPSCASASRSTPTASTTWSPSVDAVGDAEVDALVAEYDDSYDVAPELRPGGERHDVAALRRPGSRSGCATFLDRRRLRRLHRRTSRTSAGCGSCPAWPSSG